jgi:hypothetical protein
MVHTPQSRRRPDVHDSVEELVELSDKEAQKKIDFLGASFGPPDAEDFETKTLEPGKYAVCASFRSGRRTKSRPLKGHLT